MRLIDADKVKAYIIASIGETNSIPERALSLYEFIDMIPTAFDINKVTSKLKTEFDLAKKEKNDPELWRYYDFNKGYAEAMYIALEFLKDGGFDGE